MVDGGSLLSVGIDRPYRPRRYHPLPVLAVRADITGGACPDADVPDPGAAGAGGDHEAGSFTGCSNSESVPRLYATSKPGLM